MKRARSRLRPTLFLQIIAAAASLLIFGMGLMMLEHLPSAWLLVALVIIWFVGLELYGLPTLLEWLVLRQAETRGGVLRSAWFTYSPDADDASARRRHRRDTRDNPTLW